MKLSATVPILILTVACLIGWLSNLRLLGIREEHRKLVIRAKKIEITTEGDQLKNTSLSPSPNRKKTAQLASVETLTQDLVRAGKQLYRDRRFTDFEDLNIWPIIRNLYELDQEQIKMVIASIRKSPELDDQIRSQILGIIVLNLSEENPETAFMFFSESADFLNHQGIGREILPIALANWAAKDPHSALTWMRHNAFNNDKVKVALISGTARENRSLAIRLMNNLNMQQHKKVHCAITRSTTTNEQRFILLNTIRAEVTDLKTKDGIIASLASLVSQDGFESAMDWLEKAALAPAELEAFSNGLSTQRLEEDIGSWMEWLGTNSPQKGRQQRVSDLMRRWTQRDFKAAAMWLNNTGDDSLKRLAVPAFANEIAQHDPEAATQWALTLPAGSERNKLIRLIHKN